MNRAEILAELRKERERLNTAIQALEGLNSVPVKGRRTMSPEARARIGAAMKKRWAERKARKVHQMRRTG